MDNFVIKLMDVLHKHNIHCMFNKRDEIVYSLYKSVYGEVFNLYNKEESEITAYAIFSHPISKIRKQAVLDYITDLDTGKYKGCFFIDESTNCVAYEVSYCLKSEIDYTESSHFENFCITTQVMFEKHLPELYRLITNKSFTPEFD